MWTRLIRFVDEQGDEQYGDAIDATLKQAKVIKFKQSVFDEQDAVVTDEVKSVTKLLAPLQRSDVPAIKCIGLNYKKHIIEAGRKLPPYPSIFLKSTTCLAGPGHQVEIPKICQDPPQTDYEGEFCVVIGKTGKNIPREEAMSYVAGYTCGNDVSSRLWQRDPSYAGVVPQWSFSKGFDGYAPIGPAIVSTKIIPDPKALQLTTKVNGDLRQDTSVGDLCFPTDLLVSFLSTGTTLEAGTVIMTGTPGGVGFGMKPEPQWLKPGDKVEIEISNIGVLENTFAHE